MKNQFPYQEFSSIPSNLQNRRPSMPRRLALSMSAGANSWELAMSVRIWCSRQEDSSSCSQSSGDKRAVEMCLTCRRRTMKVKSSLCMKRLCFSGVTTSTPRHHWDVERPPAPTSQRLFLTVSTVKADRAKPGVKPESRLGFMFRVQNQCVCRV
mgnify:CR=1 FL=1